MFVCFRVLGDSIDNPDDKYNFYELGRLVNILRPAFQKIIEEYLEWYDKEKKRTHINIRTQYKRR